MLKRMIKSLLRRSGYEMRRIDAPMPKVQITDRLRHMKAQGFRPSLVVDVGAAYGNWTRAAREIFPKARFELIEPNPIYRDALKDESAVFAAAGSEPGSSKLYVPDKPGGGSLIPTTHGSFFKTSIDIEVVRLDDVIQEAVDLLKLDVQGFELEALAGAKRILDEAAVVILECSLYRFQGVPLIHEVIEYLTARDFRIYDYGSDTRWASGTLAQLDLAFVRDDHFLRDREHQH